MGYWVHDAGFLQFARKYLSIVIGLAAIFTVVGALSGYTSYVLSSAGPAVNETCGTNLANCISALNTCSGNLTNCTAIKDTNTQLYNKCKYDLEQISTLADDLKSELDAAESSNSDLQDKIDDYLGQIAGLEQNISSAQSNITELQSTVSNMTVQIEDLQDRTDAIVASAANRICCIQKIYDPTLAYYYLNSTSIVCTSEANETLGTEDFSC